MKERKKVTVSFRITKDEGEALRQLARVSNSGSLSEYIRTNALSQLDRISTPV